MYNNVYDQFIGGVNGSLELCKINSNLSHPLLGIIKTTAKIIDGKLVSVKSEIVE